MLDGQNEKAACMVQELREEYLNCTAPIVYLNFRQHCSTNFSVYHYACVWGAVPSKINLCLSGSAIVNSGRLIWQLIMIRCTSLNYSFPRISFASLAAKTFISSICESFSDDFIAKFSVRIVIFFISPIFASMSLADYGALVRLPRTAP